MKEKEKNDDAPGQNKVFTIYVNTREKTFQGKEISYQQVVELAYGPGALSNDQIIYTVDYSKGEDKKPKGSLVQGQTVHVKEGMVFDVMRTDKS
ncbi:MAG: multiubiquitin domain-containing protein [Bacteroidota bacterium]